MPKTYLDCLNEVIEMGIEAATRDYHRPDQKQKLDGSIEGFNLCRRKDSAGLTAALNQSLKKANEKFLEQADDYWYWRCLAAEVEWVCNVMSAILHAQGMPIIINPTAAGTITAAKIIGVANG